MITALQAVAITSTYMAFTDGTLADGDDLTAIQVAVPNATQEILDSATTAGILTTFGFGYSAIAGVNITYLVQKANLLEDISTNDPITGFSYTDLITNSGFADIAQYDTNRDLYDSIVNATTNSVNSYSELVPDLARLGAFLDFISTQANGEVPQP